MNTEEQAKVVRRQSSAPQPTGLSSAANLAVDEPSQVAIPAEGDSMARARARAAELLSNVDDLDQGEDRFYINPEAIPQGWTYEWRRHSTLGKTDPSYQVTLARSGWEPVPVSRHPEMMPVGWEGNVIEREGMILMERPAEITERMKAMDMRNARSQVRSKEMQLNGAPAGDNSPFAPTNKGSPLVNIGKSYEAMPIPKK